MQYLDAVSKMTEWPQFISNKLFNTIVMQVYAPTTDAKEAKFKSSMKTYKTNTKKKKMSFHHRGLECESRKSRDTWTNRQVWPWSTKWSRAKLIEFCQENTLAKGNILFQQHKRRLYTLTSPDGQFWKQIDYILCSQRWRSSIKSAKTRPEADCGLDHEPLIVKFRLKLKKVG